MKLSIIMPAHNEEKNIAGGIDEAVEVMKKLGLNYEIIVVDDGSDDNTFYAASEIAEKNTSYVKVIKLDHNYGKGFAISKGFEQSTGELISFIDADFSMRPRQLVNFIPKIKYADIVVGSKRHPESKVNYPPRRKFLSRGFNFLVNHMFNLCLSDTQCGFKLFKRRVLERILPKMRLKKYAFDVELLVLAKKMGFRIVEAPITLFHTNEQMKTQDMFGMWRDLLTIFYQLHFTKKYE